jgi:tRNA(adenine34) deaminase
MNYPLFSDEYFMNEALKEAKKATSKDEVPVGAVIVCDNVIIARGHNMTEELTDVTAHAEILAITSAENYLGNKFLTNCTLYVTIEPCPMCASASKWAQLSRIVYGASDPKSGYLGISPALMHPKTEIVTGILEKECGEMMSEFFRGKR